MNEKEIKVYNKAIEKAARIAEDMNFGPYNTAAQQIANKIREAFIKIKTRKKLSKVS